MEINHELIYLEPKLPLFWLEKTLFWRVKFQTNTGHLGSRHTMLKLFGNYNNKNCWEWTFTEKKLWYTELEPWLKEFGFARNYSQSENLMFNTQLVDMFTNKCLKIILVPNSDETTCKPLVDIPFHWLVNRGPSIMIYDNPGQLYALNQPTCVLIAVLFEKVLAQSSFHDIYEHGHPCISICWSPMPTTPWCIDRLLD